MFMITIAKFKTPNSIFRPFFMLAIFPVIKIYPIHHLYLIAGNLYGVILYGVIFRSRKLRKLRTKVCTVHEIILKYEIRNFLEFKTCMKFEPTNISCYTTYELDYGPQLVLCTKRRAIPISKTYWS